MNQPVIAVHLSGDESLMFYGKPLMLQPVLFCPALTWCARAWTARGTERFFLVCDEPWREAGLACFPKGSAQWTSPEDWAGVLAGLRADGAEVEEIRDPVMPRGGMMIAFHTMEELSRLQDACHADTIAYHRRHGVSILDGVSTFIDPRATIAPGTVLLPGTILRGETEIGPDCEIGPNTMLENCKVGKGCVINTAQAKDSTIEEGCDIGPYTHIRPNCVVGKGSHIGAFVQLKNCNLGQGTKMSHLTYVGDADVGEGCNFGCGTITSNYDGFKKHRTTIGNHAFIGCNTNLVAPVTVGDGVYVAAGTTVTKDVPADSLAIGRCRQENKEGWAATNRKLKGK